MRSMVNSMAEHTPTPWAYRPKEYDDWGVIRGPAADDGFGWIVASARAGRSVTPEEESDHRRAKTDPYGANATFIVRACNAYDDLVAVLATVQKGIERGYIKDQSLVPRAKPDDTELDLTSLSEMVNAALSKAKATP